MAEIQEVVKGTQELIAEYFAVTASQVMTVTKTGEEYLKANPSVKFEGAILSMAESAGFVASTVDPAKVEAQEKLAEAIWKNLQSGAIKPHKTRGEGDPAKRQNFTNLLKDTPAEALATEMTALVVDAISNGKNSSTNVPQSEYKVDVDTAKKEVAIRYMKDGIWQQTKIVGSYPGSVAYNLKVALGKLDPPKKTAKVIVAS